MPPLHSTSAPSVPCRTPSPIAESISRPSQPHRAQHVNVLPRRRQAFTPGQNVAADALREIQSFHRANDINEKRIKMQSVYEDTMIERASRQMESLRPGRVALHTNLQKECEKHMVTNPRKVAF